MTNRETRLEILNVKSELERAERNYRKIVVKSNHNLALIKDSVLKSPTGDVIADYSASNYSGEQIGKTLEYLIGLESDMEKNRGDYVGVIDLIEYGTKPKIKRKNLAIGKINERGSAIQKGRNDLFLNLGLSMVRYNGYSLTENTKPTAISINDNYPFSIEFKDDKLHVRSGIDNRSCMVEKISFGKNNIIKDAEKNELGISENDINEMFKMLDENQ